MDATAIVIVAPEHLDVRRVEIVPPTAGQIVVDVEWSGISTGTERLLWTGRMPPFPGMGYPLVPGYESVGRVVEADASASVAVGDRVFIPGSSCFVDLRGLFGGSASRLVVPSTRVTPLPSHLREEGILLALAATAHHALVNGDGRAAELIIGHGVLGRLLARIAVAHGASPVVWEKNPVRVDGAVGYRVVDPADDARRDYRAIYDVSGDASLVDTLISRLGRGGEIVLAGFYDKIEFAFPAAFVKEARLRVATEFLPADVQAVLTLLNEGRLSLDGLITHRRPYQQAQAAYATAFTDPTCLKMLLEWRADS